MRRPTRMRGLLLSIPAVFPMKCPICKKTVEWEANPYRPFCSERCRERDLGNWAAEKYVVSEPIFDEDDEELTDLPNPNDANH